MTTEVKGSDMMWILHTAQDPFPIAEVSAVIPGQHDLLWITSDCLLEFNQ